MIHRRTSEETSDVNLLVVTLGWKVPTRQLGFRQSLRPTTFGMIRSGPRPPVARCDEMSLLMAEDKEYGIYAPCQLSVDVESADLIGRGKKDDRYYQLSCRQVLPHRKEHRAAAFEGVCGILDPGHARRGEVGTSQVITCVCQKNWVCWCLQA